jgi:hypothetical protein
MQEKIEMRLLSSGSTRWTIITLTLTTALSVANVQAQPPGAGAGADTVVYGWSYKAGGLLNLSQAYYDNWAKGGDDAFAYQWNFNGEANLKREAYTWETKAKAIYGRTKLGDLGSRKSSDQFDFETVYTRLLKILVHPFASATAQSQFFPGFSYAGTPVERTQISDYFNPAYFTQTLGLGIEPIPGLKERLGATMKQTVGDYGFQSAGVRTGEDFLQEYGVSSITEYDVTLMENIQASTRLDLFANFKGVDAIDGRWANRITAKVNKWVNANFEYELLYDKDLSESAQTREGLSIGISFLTL